MSNTLKAAILALKGRIADAYAKVVEKGGTIPSGQTQDSAYLPTAIASIPAGGGGSIYNDKYPINDIIFTDHTGGIFYSCSISEASNLTEMPAAPTYPRLVFDKYTHTLAQIKDGKPHVVGAVYKTIQDTKYGVADILYMRVVAMPYNNNEVVITFPTLGTDYMAEITWGDGTVEVAHFGNNSHTYEDRGEYDVVIRRTGTRSEQDKIICDQARVIYMSSWSNSIPLSSTSSNSVLEEIMLPDVVIAATSAFHFLRCAAIKSLVWNKLDHQVSLNNTAVRFFVAPNYTGTIFNAGSNSVSMPNLTAVEAYTCKYNNIYGGVNWISIKSISALPAAFLSGNTPLKKVWLPSDVQSIGINPFRYCKVEELHIASTTPPTLSSTANIGFANDAKLYVPSNSVSLYKTDTNWAALFPNEGDIIGE